MKKRIPLALTVCIALILTAVSCSSKGNNPVASTTTYSTTAAADSCTQTTFTEVAEMLPTDITDDRKPEDIGTTDEQITEMILTLSGDLKRLYNDFFDSNSENLVFSIDETERINLYNENGAYVFFYPVHSEIIKTVDDLKNYIKQFCTSEFTERLFKESGTAYADYNDMLYISPDLSGYMGAFASKYVNYHIVDAKIVATYYLIGDDRLDEKYGSADYIHNTENDYLYTITFENTDSHWRISDCSNIVSHGKCYQSADYGIFA